MLNVLYLLPAEKFGGAERQGTLTLKLLEEFNIRATALVGPGKMILEAFNKEGIVNFIYTDKFPDDPKHPLSFVENIKRWFYNLNCFIKSRKVVLGLLKTQNFDLIYATRTFSWLVSGFVTRKTGIPVIWRCGSRFTDSFQRNIARWFMNFCGVKALVSNCDAMKQSWGEGITIPSYVINSSVNSEMFSQQVDPSAFAKKHSLDRKKKYVGIAARPAPEKGPEFLISTIKMLLKKNTDFELLWAGESSWRNHLEGLFNASGLSERVKFLGHVPDIENFYALCDVVILTSKPDSIEASPSAVLEPMSMGKPVIATEVGGIPEIIEDRKNGLMVKYGDAEGFSDAINSVLNDAQFGKTLGLEARKKIVESHNIRSNTQKLSEIFHSVAFK